MKSTNFFYIIMLCVSLCGCDFKCSIGSNQEVKTKPVTSADHTTLNGAIIKNDIDLEVTGVKVKEVYLVDAKNNVLTENKAGVGEKIYAVIKLDTGWVKENGKSFIGASERILTSSGRVVVSADDIFKDYEATGLDAEDAKVVSLSAVITEPGTETDEFSVQFRVWDKKGKGEVKGKYKFSLKK